MAMINKHGTFALVELQNQVSSATFDTTYIPFSTIATSFQINSGIGTHVDIKENQKTKRRKAKHR
jgi:hypothetical protein